MNQTMLSYKTDLLFRNLILKLEPRQLQKISGDKARNFLVEGGAGDGVGPVSTGFTFLISLMLKTGYGTVRVGQFFSIIR